MPKEKQTVSKQVAVLYARGYYNSILRFVGEWAERAGIEHNIPPEIMGGER